MTNHADYIVIGAGIAGTSAASKLAQYGHTIVLEKEAFPGYHTTGRSAAFFTENYGNNVIRNITKASRNFLENPPQIFGNIPLMNKTTGCLFIATKNQEKIFEIELKKAKSLCPDIREIELDVANSLSPSINNSYIHRVFREPDAMHMDVDLIHQGYIKSLKSAKGELICNAEVNNIIFKNKLWYLNTTLGEFCVPKIINAAGSWCDEIAKLADQEVIGIQPLRRTAITFADPMKRDISNWPLVIDIEEKFYFRPDAGKILASPADEIISEPCDIQPEIEDVAITVARIESATDMKINKIDHKWAGLRNFVADRTPVLGEKIKNSGFFWLAAQGGYGIMTSPALSEIIESLVLDKPFPKSLENFEIEPESFSPNRPNLNTIKV